MERAFAAGEGDGVKAAFNASNLIGTRLGDDDFWYAVADGVAMLDQVRPLMPRARTTLPALEGWRPQGAGVTRGWARRRIRNPSRARDPPGSASEDRATDPLHTCDATN